MVLCVFIIRVFSIFKVFFLILANVFFYLTLYLDCNLFFFSFSLSLFGSSVKPSVTHMQVAGCVSNASHIFTCPTWHYLLVIKDYAGVFHVPIFYFLSKLRWE